MINVDSNQTEYLNNLKDALLKVERKDIEISREWANGFPNKAGVYVVYENLTLVYVGETKSIRDRMSDMLDTRHHTLRRKIGEINFSDLNDFKKATSKLKYPLSIEKMVNDWLSNKMQLSFLPMKIGRKELEELIIKDLKPKYNSDIKRGC